MKLNEFKHYRGLNFAVINPYNGKVWFAQVFDTYVSSESFEKWISETEIPVGFIIAAACKDECSKNLSQKVKDWFTALGSKYINDVKYRLSYAFIGRYMGPG